MLSLPWTFPRILLFVAKQLMDTRALDFFLRQNADLDYLGIIEIASYSVGDDGILLLPYISLPVS